MRFMDRRDAGRQLAAALAHVAGEQPVVVGLPRGGVPVAYEVARALGAPLDVLVVRKLGCPWQPELGVGALGEGGIRLLNRGLMREVGVTESELGEVIEREQQELEARVARYRGDRSPIPIENRTVIVVDDGLATGFTARAAIEVLRRRRAGRVVLAVPVAPVDTIAELRGVADDGVCLHTPAVFWAIGEFYDDFAQTTDAEVTRLLAADDPPEPVTVTIEHDLDLPGTLSVPAGATGVVVFAHGSGSSRLSPRNIAVARALNQAGLATLLFDLLTPDEARDRAQVFDIELLAMRLGSATRWLSHRRDLASLHVGYFGASTGAAAALWAAADLDEQVGAVVSRGGRPDLAAPRLAEVSAPTLLIVGSRDNVVINLNEQAQRLLRCPNELAIVPGATHLFEEPGALEHVARLAADWFTRHLTVAARPAGHRRPQPM